MKRILLIVFLLVFVRSTVWANPLVLLSGPANLGGGSPSYTCVGFDDCTPSITPTTESATTNADRHYTRPYTATGNGTAVSVITYITAYGAAEGWAVLYRQNEGTGDSILIGQCDITTPTVDTWQEWTLTAVGGQNLTFDSDDVLYFGVVFNTPAGTCALGREDAGGPGLYYMTTDVSDPLSSVTTWLIVAGRNMALILKYQ